MTALRDLRHTSWEQTETWLIGLHQLYGLSNDSQRLAATEGRSLLMSEINVHYI
jgi:hypothetical protein